MNCPISRRLALQTTVFPLLAGPVGWASSGARAEAAAPGREALAARLRAGGAVLLMRHAVTDPGVGDPPGFRLGDCASQRNLSTAGRAQAQRLGAWFGARGLKPARVRSSAWCRCVDTGTLAFGRAEVWEPLNSFFGDSAAQAGQTAALGAALAGVAPGGFEVWVTHQVNMSAWLGGFAAMGEGWVVVPAAAGAAAPRLVGRLLADV